MPAQARPGRIHKNLLCATSPVQILTNGEMNSLLQSHIHPALWLQQNSACIIAAVLPERIIKECTTAISKIRTANTLCFLKLKTVFISSKVLLFYWSYSNNCKFSERLSSILVLWVLQENRGPVRNSLGEMSKYPTSLLTLAVSRAQRQYSYLPTIQRSNSQLTHQNVARAELRGGPARGSCQDSPGGRLSAEARSSHAHRWHSCSDSTRTGPAAPLLCPLGRHSSAKKPTKSINSTGHFQSTFFILLSTHSKTNLCWKQLFLRTVKYKIFHKEFC